MTGGIEGIHLDSSRGLTPLPSRGRSHHPSSAHLQSGCNGLPIRPEAGPGLGKGWSCGREERGWSPELNYCSFWAPCGNLRADAVAMWGAWGQPQSVGGPASPLMLGREFVRAAEYPCPRPGPFGVPQPLGSPGSVPCSSVGLAEVREAVEISQSLVQPEAAAGTCSQRIRGQTSPGAIQFKAKGPEGRPRQSPSI